jgi:hypothetical protein
LFHELAVLVALEFFTLLDVFPTPVCDKSSILIRCQADSSTPHCRVPPSLEHCVKGSDSILENTQQIVEFLLLLICSFLECFLFTCKAYKFIRLEVFLQENVSKFYAVIFASPGNCVLGATGPNQSSNL